MNVKKAAFQVLLCKAMVCIAELMAFKMSKGNVAHRKKKKKSYSFPCVGFHLKLVFVHCALRWLSSLLQKTLSLSPKAAGSNANLDGRILNLLMFTLPCELELAWHLKDAPVFVRMCFCSAHLFLF